MIRSGHPWGRLIKTREDYISNVRSDEDIPEGRLIKIREDSQ